MKTKTITLNNLQYDLVVESLFTLLNNLIKEVEDINRDKITEIRFLLSLLGGIKFNENN